MGELFLGFEKFRCGLLRSIDKDEIFWVQFISLQIIALRLH